MADYKPGEMDITAQEKTFEGFVKTVGYGAAIVLVFLLFLGLLTV
ncbi:aa3-type cytochrome c oxidase subunit IV [Pseudoruegeria sp. HB172150]|nr:aa3-type cytochrome c oxidase subunit IV [Pseudoruegeria sp. HB172150]